MYFFLKYFPQTIFVRKSNFFIAIVFGLEIRNTNTMLKLIITIYWIFTLSYFIYYVYWIYWAVLLLLAIEIVKLASRC